MSSGRSGVFEGAKGLKRARSVTSRNIPGWAKFGPGEQAQKTRTVKRHEDTNASQVNQKERAAQSREKEAGPAGGESWARVYGPALGGEAGAVLIGSLSAKGSRIDTGVVSATGPVSPHAPSCGFSQSNYNICRRA